MLFIIKKNLLKIHRFRSKKEFGTYGKYWETENCLSRGIQNTQTLLLSPCSPVKKWYGLEISLWALR